MLPEITPASCRRLFFPLLLVCSTPSEMARPAGLEPATLGLEGRCSIRLSYERITHRRCKPDNPVGIHSSACTGNGRGRGIRTPDTLLPKQVRYQTALYPVLHQTRAQCGGRG